MPRDSLQWPQVRGLAADNDVVLNDVSYVAQLRQGDLHEGIGMVCEPVFEAANTGTERDCAVAAQKESGPVVLKLNSACGHPAGTAGKGDLGDFGMRIHGVNVVRNAELARGLKKYAS